MSDGISDVCSSDLGVQRLDRVRRPEPRQIAVHRHGLQPARAQAGEGEAAEALGQRLAAGTGDQRQVAEGGPAARTGSSQRLEELHLYGGVGEVVLAADTGGYDQPAVVAPRGVSGERTAVPAQPP